VYYAGYAEAAGKKESMAVILPLETAVRVLSDVKQSSLKASLCNEKGTMVSG
jgi:hypothetical protein